MTVVDRIKDGRGCILCTNAWTIAIDQGLDGTGEMVDQRDFDENQRIIGHGAMKEGEAPAIISEPAAQITPALDGMNAFIC